MSYPKEEMHAMKIKGEEEYKEYCKSNGINHDLKVKQRERQYEARMKSIICPNCNKEMRFGTLKRHQTLHCKAKPSEEL